MTNTTPTNRERTAYPGLGLIRELPRLLYITAVAATILLAPTREAKASCGSGRDVIVGQLPDVFFAPGVTNVKEFTYTYKNIGGSEYECGSYAESTMPGVAVINTYGDRGREAFPPEVTGTGTSSEGYPQVTTTLKIKVLATAPAGSGAINIYQRTCRDICFGLSGNTFDRYYPDKLMLIGKVNVYVTGRRYATTFVATVPATSPSFSPLATNAFLDPGFSTASSFFVNHPATNLDPAARLIVTPNWNPGGAGGVYNDHAFGVLYAARSNSGTPMGRWSVYNEDSGQMNTGASFNLRIGGSASFNHQTNLSNNNNNWTVIDNPITNNNPNAIVFVTHNYSGGAVRMKHNHTMGVWYTDDRWAIFNQDGTAMPSGVNFTVQAFGYPGNGVFVLTTNAANTAFNYTWIDNPLTNNNPNATIFVTPNFNPGGRGATYVYPPVGVYYDSYQRKWAIFCQNRSLMPIDASFNVLIPVAPIYWPLLPEQRSLAGQHRAAAGEHRQ